jgi:homocitrate synthase NifV
MAPKDSVCGVRRILIRDSTLREGLDVPGVSFSGEQRLRISKLLDRSNVPEIEIVAPGRVLSDLEFAARLKAENLQIKASGLVFASSPRFREEVDAVSACLDRFDILMPVSEQRKPYDCDTKTRLLLDALDYSLRRSPNVGVGFPHSTQAALEFLLELCKESAKRGAVRVLIYDTNGGADPFGVYSLIRHLKENVDAPLLFHAHNDLGMATANSLAAVFAGADGLDVTVNGLGDRAGNASLEQVVMALHLRDLQTGIALSELRELSEVVEQESGIQVSKLAPVVGEFVAAHKSPAHLEIPELFEAFDPSLVGVTRKITR